MKLARVDHRRCDQPAGKWGLTTYVWMPDDMSEHEFGLLCEAARDKYLANEEEWKKVALPIPSDGTSVDLNDYRVDMTVGEIKTAIEVRATAYKKYETKRANARKNFSTLLVEVSNGAITHFWNSPPLVKHELHWGHNHGVTIDHGETKVSDYPPEDDGL